MTRFMERLERGEGRTVMGLGDSLTFGYMVSRGYLHIVRDALVRRFPEAGLVVDNQGACGDTAAGGRARLRHLLVDRSPDLALIQFGINDAFVGIHVNAFRKDLEALVAAFRKARPDCEVVLIPAPPLAWDEDDAYVEPFRRAAWDVAAAHEAWVAPVGIFYHRDRAGAYLADGVHPSEKGHAWIAEAVLRALESVHIDKG